MDTIIQKWGNSLGVRIPLNIARGLHLKKGCRVDISGDDSKIVIRPKNKKNLKEMLQAITADNIHGEFDPGGEAGNEIW